MKIFDLNDSNVYPFEERDKNVLFCVLQGKGIITVNEKSNEVKPHSLLITPPATISMMSDEGMKVLGIQIVKGGT